MDTVGMTAETLQQALGPTLDRLGRTTGAIRRRRKYSGTTLLRRLVLTVLRVPRARTDDYVTTATLLGVTVTPRAVEKRFTPRLVAFLRQALDGLLPQAIAAALAAVPLLSRFTAVFVGDSTTIALPDQYGLPEANGQMTTLRIADSITSRPPVRAV